MVEQSSKNCGRGFQITNYLIKEIVLHSRPEKRDMDGKVSTCYSLNCFLLKERNVGDTSN